jgi:hypothetical protein
MLSDSILTTAYTGLENSMKVRPSISLTLKVLLLVSSFLSFLRCWASRCQTEHSGDLVSNEETREEKQIYRYR